MVNEWCMGFCSFWFYQTEKRSSDLHHYRARHNNTIGKFSNTDLLSQRKRPSTLNKNKLALFTLTPSDRNNHCNMSNKHNFVLFLVCVGLESKWYKCHCNQAVVVWCVDMKVLGGNTHSTVANAVDSWFIKLLFVRLKLTPDDQSDSSFRSLVDSLSTASLLSKGGIWSVSGGDWFWESWQGLEGWAFGEASSADVPFSPSTSPSGSSWSFQKKWKHLIWR